MRRASMTNLGPTETARASRQKVDGSDECGGDKTASGTPVERGHSTSM